MILFLVINIITSSEVMLKIDLTVLLNNVTNVQYSSLIFLLGVFIRVYLSFTQIHESSNLSLSHVLTHSLALN